MRIVGLKGCYMQRSSGYIERREKEKDGRGIQGNEGGEGLGKG